MDILIVGAGPTGLTAAIELYRHGFKPRIIDRKEAPSPLSRAVGINARSLELLEASGATRRLLEHGIHVKDAAFYDGAQKLGSIHFSLLPHRYNFLLALPQNETEAILGETLAQMGGCVEYSSPLTQLRFEGESALAAIGDQPEQPFDLVIGADGIHSRVREAAGIPFEGYEYDDTWSIADFECPDWPEETSAFFLPGGHFRIVIKIGKKRYRAVADEPDALKDIPIPFTVTKLNRADTFVISVRQAQTYQKPPVYLAGDAAHVHSPFGGRGMNLGIEDACVLAKRIKEGSQDGYTAARHPVAKEWIAFSERGVHMVITKSKLKQWLRRAFFDVLSMVPALQKAMLLRTMGLRD